MTILFEDTLQQLFQHLGIAYPEEAGIDTYPALVLDEQMIVHFVLREDRIELITSLGGLPDQVPMLSKLLILNYSEAPYPVCFASDGEGNDLLAIIRLPLESTSETLLAALQALVLQIEASKTEIDATVVSNDITEKLQMT